MLRELPAYVRVGSGLGTFEDSFAPLTPAGATARWDRAHNDYLQLLWETGIPGATLFVVGLWIFIRKFWWPALTGRERPVDFFRAGLAVSLLSIALHSGVDFCLQIGANAFLCALLAGLIVALHRGTDTPLAGSSPVRAIAGPWTE
jgi:O-antigen ligase